MHSYKECKLTSCFFFCHTKKHVGFEFPDQGVSLCPPAVEACSLTHWTASGVPQLASCDHMINHAVNILCKLESAAFGPVALYVKPRALPLGLGNFPQQDLITACVTSSGNFWFFLIRLYCRLCFKRSEPAVWTPFPA